MTKTPSHESTRQKPLRLRPGVVIVVLQWLVRFGIPIVLPSAYAVALFGGVAGGLAVVVWWAFFSRAHGSERWGAVGLMIVAAVATRPFLHDSVKLGMMGLMFPFFLVPVLSLAFVAWAVASHRLADGPRRATMAVAIFLACGSLTLVRTHGVTGDSRQDFAWRWAESPEERLLARADEPMTRLPASTAPEDETGMADLGAPDRDWPGFRGPLRDGVIRGLRIESDWSASPPVELWRRPVGPGWSSFAVRGGLLYTQEQRGEDELVSCYDATTGEPVWRHRDPVRFWESQGGAGPRATPTVSGGRAYTFGATGILNALDAADGSVVWSRNAASDAGTEAPYWGFSSSPLVVDDVVLVDAGALAAHDLATGEPRWSASTGKVSYSSPHLVTLDGVTQVLLLSAAGAKSMTPADGTVLWEHPWEGFSMVQPALTADGDVLIGAGGGVGMSRVAIVHGAGGWTTEERWASKALKPYFNDLVVHQGHAFGFDGSILACIDLEDGQRKWKGGRYGHGQLVLLADQGLLLVLSEKGELALVAATTERFTELARWPAIEGKTWNHPVVVGDLLLVRNGQEMVAFRLPLAAA